MGLSIKAKLIGMLSTLLGTLFITLIITNSKYVGFSEFFTKIYNLEYWSQMTFGFLISFSLNVLSFYFVYLPIKAKGYFPIYWSTSSLLKSIVKSDNNNEKEKKTHGKISSGYVNISKSIIARDVLQQVTSYHQDMDKSKIILAFTSSNPTKWYYPSYLEYLFECQEKCEKFGINTVNREWYEENLNIINNDNVGDGQGIFIRIFIYDGDDINNMCLGTIMKIHRKLKIPYFFLYKAALKGHLLEINDKNLLKSYINFFLWQMGKNKDSYAGKLNKALIRIRCYLGKEKVYEQMIFKHLISKSIKNDTFLDFVVFYIFNDQAQPDKKVYYNNKQFNEPNSRESIIRDLLSFMLGEWHDNQDIFSEFNCFK